MDHQLPPVPIWPKDPSGVNERTLMATATRAEVRAGEFFLTNSLA